MVNKIEQTITKLKKEIRYHRNLYYQKSDPEITDQAFDKLIEELITYKNNYPNFFSSDDPLVEVGSSAQDKFKKIQHKTIMGSLNNAHSDDDILEFLTSLTKFLSIPNFQTSEEITKAKNLLPFLCEPKIDGIALSLLYQGTKLVYAATRGNGQIGEDVTSTAKQIKDIPQTLNLSLANLSQKEKEEFEIEIRGEVYLTHEAFFELKNNDTNLKLARSAAGGILRSLDHLEPNKKKLSFAAHSFGFAQPYLIDLCDFNYLKVMEAIECFGFNLAKPNFIANNYQEMIDYYNNLLSSDNDINYDFDGIVFKLNDLKLNQRLGFVSKYPRWAIAYKIPSSEMTTKLLDVTFQVSRHGTLSPVAILEPVTIDGSLVARASLYNIDEIERLKIGINDKVSITRAGQTIPKILAVTYKSKNSLKINIPKTCPSCGAKVKKIMAQLRCQNNLSCKDQRLSWLRYIVSKEVFDISGLGFSIISRFSDEGIIHLPQDIYKLRQHQDKILALDGFGKKSLDGLLEQIEKTKNISFDKFILSLGIESVGVVLAKVFAQTFISYKNLISNLEYLQTYINSSDDNLSIEDKLANFFKTASNQNSVESKNIFCDLYSKSGVGLSTIINVLNFFSKSDRLEVSNQLFLEISPKDYEKPNLLDSEYSGKKVVFTGKLSISRAEAKSIAEKNSMIISSALSVKTDLLVCGEKPGSKLKLAKELGVKVIYEDEFISKLAK